MDNDRWKLWIEIGGVLGAALLTLVGISSGNMWVWAMGVIWAIASLALVVLFFE